MTTEESNIARAWLAAADDLGLIVITPFILKTDEGDYSFIALIKDFGSPKGTLICLSDAWNGLSYADIAEEYGYYCSGLYPNSYSQYDRQHFIDTLDDWKWFGDETSPPWYRGRTWGDNS